MVVAQGCHVRDNHGMPVDLSDTPLGVTYDREMDTLRCFTPKICDNWTIESCAAVHCQAEQACIDAHFANNLAVACWSKEACQFASFSDSHEVACGDGDEDSCDEARIQIDRQLLCYGKHACMYHKNVNVGTTGQIRCASGRGDFVCGNMDVIVKHGDRACFTHDLSTGGSPCAVVCLEDSDCDKHTILFTVE